MRDLENKKSSFSKLLRTWLRHHRRPTRSKLIAFQHKSPHTSSFEHNKLWWSLKNSNYLHFCATSLARPPTKPPFFFFVFVAVGDLCCRMKTRRDGSFVFTVAPRQKTLQRLNFFLLSDLFFVAADRVEFFKAFNWMLQAFLFVCLFKLD